MREGGFVTHIEIEHEPMGLIIRASGIVSNGECDNGGCDDLGMYVPDRSRPRVLVRGLGGLYRSHLQKKWASLFEGLDEKAVAMLKLNINEMFYEELKTDIEWKEEQGRE